MFKEEKIICFRNVSFFSATSFSLFRQFCLELNGLAVKLQVSPTVPPSTDTPPSVWWSDQLVRVSPPPEWVPSRHLHPDDSHRAVDLSLCCSQDPERGQSDLLWHNAPFSAMARFMRQKMELTCVVLLLCRQCPAIDYTRHTLDGAACLLNSNKYFPSRLVSKLYFTLEKSVE